MGNAVVLAAVACEFDNPVSEDFTPLTVNILKKNLCNSKTSWWIHKKEKENQVI